VKFTCWGFFITKGIKMKSVQYKHANNWAKKEWFGKQFTAVCIVPEKQDFLEGVAISLTQEVVFDIAVGVTYVNPNDQYSKAIGRTEALHRTKTETFKIQVITSHENGKTIFCLKNIDSSSNAPYIYLETKYGRDRVYFVDILVK
jgi:hypothetical protein